MGSRKTLRYGARAVRGARPGGFAVVMATGIVSTALRQAGHLWVSAVLLAIAAAAGQR